jgi:hypothetical protein
MKMTKKKDAGSIFNPVMYLMLLLLTAQLLLLFVEYKRVTWVSTAVTDTMTDALLGACTLNEEELYHFGSTDELKILDSQEKYEVFKKILCEELGLTNELRVTDKSIPMLVGQVKIKDFRVYSVEDKDITFHDFDIAGGYTTTVLADKAGRLTIENGKVIENTTLVAEIGFAVRFFGVPVNVSKYHMVDVTS